MLCFFVKPVSWVCQKPAYVGVCSPFCVISGWIRRRSLSGERGTAAVTAAVTAAINCGDHGGERLLQLALVWGGITSQLGRERFVASR